MTLLSPQEWAAQQMQKEQATQVANNAYIAQIQQEEKASEQKKEMYLFGAYAIVVLLLVLIVIKLYQINRKK